MKMSEEQIGLLSCKLRISELLGKLQVKTITKNERIELSELEDAVEWLEDDIYSQKIKNDV